METLRQVLSSEPVSPRLLQPQVPRNLEAICLKCLHKDRARRYPSAAALADDLRRFLAGKTTVARPAGLAETAWRWCRYNPALAGLMAAVALSLLAGTTAATVLAIVARGEAHRASAAQRQAEWLLYASELAHHQREWDSNNLREAWLHLDRTPVALRGWEYRYCRALFGANHEIIGSGSGRINTIHFAPGGQRLVSGGGDPLAPSKPGKVCVWNTQTGKELLTLEGHTGPVWSVCFSPDGTHFAAAGEDGIVLVWDAEGKGKPLRLEGPRAVHAVSFSPDSKRLATADDDRAVRLWDASSGQLVGTFKGPEGHTNVVTSVCFTPDGRHLLSASDDKTLLWDIDPPRAKPVTLIGHISCVTSVCLSPDGKRLASTSGDSLAPDKAGEIRIWEWGAKAWREVFTLTGHAGPVWNACFSPNGQRLASAGEDGTVRVWDVVEGRQYLLLKGHWGAVTSVCFAGDGTHLASAGADGTIRLWETDRAQGPLVFSEHKDVVLAARFSPDGTRLVSVDGGLDDTVRVWDAQTGKVVLHLEGDVRDVSDVSFSPDGRFLAGSTQSNTVRFWDAITGRELPSLQGPDTEQPGGDRFNANPDELMRAITSIGFSPDGTRLAGGSATGSIFIWNVGNGSHRLLFTLDGHVGSVKHVCFSPDGRRLATVGDDPTVRVWDVATGRPLLALSGHTASLTTVCFAPDGKCLASGGNDRTVRMWDANTGDNLFSVPVREGKVSGLAFSPDGERLVSTAGRTVQVWVAATGLQLLTLGGHEDALTGVCFSSGGTLLATSARDRTVRVWKAPLLPPAGSEPGAKGLLPSGNANH